MRACRTAYGFLELTSTSNLVVNLIIVGFYNHSNILDGLSHKTELSNYSLHVLGNSEWRFLSETRPIRSPISGAKQAHGGGSFDAPLEEMASCKSVSSGSQKEQMGAETRRNRSQLCRSKTTKFDR